MNTAEAAGLVVTGVCVLVFVCGVAGFFIYDCRRKRLTTEPPSTEK